MKFKTNQELLDFFHKEWHKGYYYPYVDIIYMMMQDEYLSKKEALNLFRVRWNALIDNDLLDDGTKSFEAIRSIYLGFIKRAKRSGLDVNE